MIKKRHEVSTHMKHNTKFDLQSLFLYSTNDSTIQYVTNPRGFSPTPTNSKEEGRLSFIALGVRIPMWRAHIPKLKWQLDVWDRATSPIRWVNSPLVKIESGRGCQVAKGRWRSPLGSSTHSTMRHLLKEVRTSLWDLHQVERTPHLTHSNSLQTVIKSQWSERER